MSTIELEVATALQKAGLLERLMQRAQEAGLSLLGYLDKCSDAAAFIVKGVKEDGAPAAHSSKSVEEIWEEMMALPTAELTRQLGPVYSECGIADMSGEELRELCRD